MGRQANGLARHSQQAVMTCLRPELWPTGVWPVLGRRFTIFLTFYADLIIWADGLTGWPRTVSKSGMMCLRPELWPAGVWPMLGRRLAIYRHALGLIPSGHRFKPHLLYHFLTFYVDLIKWADGLMGWPGTVSRPAWRAWGQSCGPRASDPCRATVWPYIGVHWVILK
jgi:hypothetical protein